MQIGELARRSALSVKTLRYYEEIGVLAAPPRTRGGYRDYEDDVVGRLEFVRAAQAVGLTLGEIREVIAFRERGEVPCGHVLDLILHHASEVERRIVELQRLRADLDRLARRPGNSTRPTALSRSCATCSSRQPAPRCSSHEMSSGRRRNAADHAWRHNLVTGKRRVASRGPTSWVITGRRSLCGTRYRTSR